MKSDIEDFISKQIKTEYETAKSNKSQEIADFEAVIDMLECKRTEKNYEWLSDVFYPEYPAVLLTESSQWASQYFATREYVAVYLEGDGPNDKEKCTVTKKLINKTLNRKGLYHYHKYMRGRTINSTGGVVYAIGGWEQKLKNVVVGQRPVPDGTMIQRPDGLMVPNFKNEDVTQDIPLKDNFFYDIIDPRNIFTDNKYCYSPQEKDWIIVRSEESYESLKEKEVTHGYFNLDKVKEIFKNKNIPETETSSESYNKDDKQGKVGKPVVKYGDVLTRYGKMWAVVLDRDEEGNPVKIEYGLDDLGDIKKSAELVECISAEFLYGSTPILIRFQPTPFIDSTGNPYKPILRGLCYIHPTKDTGMSDGKYAREMQVALNDTLNMSNDRTHLATIPTFVGDKYACEDNDQIYIEPEHIIPIDGGPDKIRELDIRDNINGALQQANLCISGIHNVTSIFPNTMGDVGQASTTATAVAGADQRSNTRQNYKSLTFEHTFLCDLYWMILQMSYRFMHPMTAEKLLGVDGVSVFDPNPDYTYQPLTSAIEQEYSKRNKMQIIDQVLGRVVNVPNPKTPALVNELMKMFFNLLGAEYQDIKEKLLDDGPEGQKAAMGITPQDTAQGIPMEMTSNQNGIPVSGMEMNARGM